jgi:hypothetical protein
VVYVGRVNGDAMSGRMKGSAAGTWTAVRGGAKPRAAGGGNV